MPYYEKCSIEIERPIFVIGMPRSGTTLISEAISTHERIGWFSNYMNKLPYLPEISFLNRIIDLPIIGRHLRGGKKQKTGFTSFLRSMLPYSTEAYPAWKLCVGNNFLRNYMIDQVADKIAKRKTRRTIKKVLLTQGKQRFFAKLTGPPRINYINSIFPDAYFIHVMRDPRATVSSLLRVPFWEKGIGLEKPWWRNGLCQKFLEEWFDSGKSPTALAAVQWKQVIELTLQESKTLNSHAYTEVRYEDFVTAPSGVLEAIFSKVNLPSSEIVQEYINSIGNVKNMNFKFHQNLTPSQILLIENITADTAQKVGYVF